MQPNNAIESGVPPVSSLGLDAADQTGLGDLLRDRVDCAMQLKYISEEIAELDEKILAAYEQHGITKACATEGQPTVYLHPWTVVNYPIARIREELVLRRVAPELVNAALEKARSKKSGVSVAVKLGKEREEQN